MRTLLVVLISIASLAPLSSSAQTWSLKNSNFPYNGVNAITPFVSVINGKAYMGTEEYMTVFDPTTNTYSQKSAPPCTHCGFASFTLNNKIYVMETGSAGYNLYEYTPSTDTWVTKSATPPFLITWPTGGSQVLVPGTPIMFSLNGKGYVGGFVAINVSNTQMYFLPHFYEYNPVTDMYATKANLPDSFLNSLASFCELNGRGYVFGGNKINSAGMINPNFAFRYDPDDNKWDTIAKPLHGSLYPGGRVGGGAFGLGDKIYFGLSGTNFNQPDTIIESYNTTTNTWTAGQWLPTKDTIRLGRGFSINGKGYLGLGSYLHNGGEMPHLKLYEFASPTAVSEPTKKEVFTVVPNPAHGDLQIHLSNGDDPGTVYLLDITGKKLGTFPITTKVQKLDISAINPGTYFIHLITREGNSQTRAVAIE